MAIQYEESRRYLDKPSLSILLGFLIATDVFVVICFFCDLILDPIWVAAIVAVSVVGAVVGYFLRLSISIDDEAVTVSFVRKHVYPKKRILDAKKGDIDVLRDYSGWGHGTSIKYRTYSVPGIDGAVSVKLGGKEVLTFTTQNPDEVYDIIYSMRRLD